MAALKITMKDIDAVYMPLLDELKSNFRNLQSGAIGAPDKLLKMLLDKLTSAVKNYSKEVGPYLPALIESFVELTNTMLNSEDEIDQSLARADGADLK